MSSPKRRSDKLSGDVAGQSNSLALVKCSDVNIVETRAASKNKPAPKSTVQNLVNTTNSQQDQGATPQMGSSFFTIIVRLMLIGLILFVVSGSTTDLMDHVPSLVQCRIRECCHPNDGTGYIRYEKGCDMLLKALNEKVHGQPFITKKIYNAVKAHMANSQPPRPLVMYFSGWTGTGKTHVAKLIASSLFKEGMKSRFVKHIIASYEFPTKIEENDIILYRQRLRDMIRDTVKQCERSLIILDELDKLPSGIVDSLQPLMDYIEDIEGVKYNKAIFIFLSNTGSESLNTLAYQVYKQGMDPLDLLHKKVEKILIEASYNETGGLRESDILKRYSIGVLVPFMPLERRHVKQCIEDEMRSLNIKHDNHEQLVEEIADEMSYFPEDVALYSMSGCKGVHDKLINHVGPPADLRLDL